MTDAARAIDETAAESESLAPAVTRAGAILDLLAENAGKAAGPSELARRLGLPKSSIANICNALADMGLVRRVGTGFALGRKLAELGGAYLASVDLVQEFYEAAQLLPVGSEETIQLAVLDGLEMTYLARHDGRQPVRLTSQIGRRLPATVTATGKAALSSLPDDDLDDRLAGASPLPTLTPNSIGTIEALRADLVAVRERGYSMDDEETVEGVVCLRRDDPRAPAGRGSLRGEHHPAEGPRDGGAHPAPDRRPASARRAAVRPATRRSSPTARGRRSEPVDGPGVHPEHCGALRVGQVGGQLACRRQHRGVRRCQQAHRPVGAEDQPFGAQHVERVVDVRG